MCGGEQEVSGTDMLSLRYLQPPKWRWKIASWIYESLNLMGKVPKPGTVNFFQHVNNINIMRQNDRTKGISVSKKRDKVFRPHQISWLGRWEDPTGSTDDSEEYRYPENQVNRKGGVTSNVKCSWKVKMRTKNWPLNLAMSRPWWSWQLHLLRTSKNFKA